MRIFKQDGSEVTSLDDWTRPMREHQWKEGRSAFELANAWLSPSGPACPPEVEALLRSSPSFDAIQLDDARPEHVTPLPMKGEGRNHDLHVRCSLAGKPVTLCIEAKADESFGSTIGKTLAVARSKNENTRAPLRARQLIEYLTNSPADPDGEPWASIRYQLLTGLTGTGLQATSDGASQAVFLIHEFVTTQTHDDRHAANQRDLDRFLALLSGDEAPKRSGALWGPFMVHANGGVPVFIGKVVTNRRPEA